MAIVARTYSLTATPIQIAGEKTRVRLFNSGTGNIWIGGPDLSPPVAGITSTGFLLRNDLHIEIVLDRGDSLYAVTATGSVDAGISILIRDL